MPEIFKAERPARMLRAVLFAACATLSVAMMTMACRAQSAAKLQHRGRLHLSGHALQSGRQFTFVDAGRSGADPRSVLWRMRRSGRCCRSTHPPHQLLRRWPRHGNSHLRPRYTWKPAHGRCSFYGQGLAGKAWGMNSVFPNPSGANTVADSLAVKAGGGMNLALRSHVVVRLSEADYFLTQLPNSTNNVQNNLALGAGMILGFK